MSEITEKEFIAVMMAYIVQQINDLKRFAEILDNRKIDALTFGIILEMNSTIANSIKTNLQYWFKYLATRATGEEITFYQDDDGSVGFEQVPFYSKETTDDKIINGVV